jgi:hypothetical protein
LLLAGGRAAQAESPRLSLDLPAQDLEHALQAYSRATGMAVLVDRELTRGRRSISVRGRFTAQEALAILLTEWPDGALCTQRCIHLAVADVSSPPVARGEAARRAARINSSYAAALQRAIEVSLCRSSLTRPGSFRRWCRFGSTARGIEHSRLVSSTGDEQRDEALVRSLGTARVERPAPSSLRQPLTLLLMPDTTGTRMDCTAGKGGSDG